MPTPVLQKVNKQQLQAVKERFLAFLDGDTQIVASEAFCNAVRSYYEGFLKSEQVSRMVQSGGCSVNNFRDVFKKNIERRVSSLPEIDGLSKETVLSSWITKYDAIYKRDINLPLTLPGSKRSCGTEAERRFTSGEPVAVNQDQRGSKTAARLHR
uniref:Calcium dependent secretion activator 2 n=1 Tax=Salarias fasciatus TaxID=181472 RepID=A0A672JEZ4_SALFA